MTLSREIMHVGSAWKGYWPLLAVLFCVVNFGCGGAVSAGTPASSTTAAQSGTEVTAGQLSANPAGLAFGNNVVGQTATQTVTLTNTGSRGQP